MAYQLEKPENISIKHNIPWEYYLPENVKWYATWVPRWREVSREQFQSR